MERTGGADALPRVRGAKMECLALKMNLVKCPSVAHAIAIDMKQDAVIQTLKRKNTELTTKFGVKSLQLFGSVARDDAISSSDVDLLVEFDRPVGYFGLFALQDYLENLLGCPVDLGTPNSLKPRIRERVMGEVIRVT